MRYSVLAGLILLLLWLPLSAQYNERQILYQQANQLYSQRQYSEAETLFLQLLEKYPDDLNSILQLMQIYLSLSQMEKADALLSKYHRSIPPNTYTELRLQLLIARGNLDIAAREAEAYLQLMNHDINKYRLIASYFERKAFFDYSLDLYQRARAWYKDPSLLGLEIANAAMQGRNLPVAVTEYMAYLKSNPGMSPFVKNQLKSIVLEDSSMVDLISSIARNNDSAVLRELYASTLVSLKDYESALEIYKSLTSNYMIDFAAEQNRLGNDLIAMEAYRYLGDTSPNLTQKFNFKMDLARLYYRQAQYDSTKAIVNSIIQDPYWNQNPQLSKSRLNMELRKLMAEASLANRDDISVARSWLEEAKYHSSQTADIQEVELDLAKLHILSGSYNNAISSLSRVTLPNLVEKRDYLKFLSAFVQHEIALADSLMNEFVIKYPGSDYVNDAIYLIMLSLGMQPDDQKRFAKSVTLLQLRNPAGIDSLYSIFEHNQDEELLLLAIEWSIGLGEYAKASLFLTHDFTDDLASDYAQLLKLAFMNDRRDEQNLAREFLKTNPNSIFSPSFRQVISRIGLSRPNL
ncbi:MAG TPA: tetratricopeptide repeat protein [Candidatus Cloacimonadota bacterium]|nr:tetratricopeptide repeat protein [Candidatus Cloacimonadota bacterium]